MLKSWTPFQSWFSREPRAEPVDRRLIDEVRRIASNGVEAGVASSSIARALGSFAAAAEGLLGMRAYDVQIQAAAAMAEGRAVEMQTGEGKTLVAAAAAARLALQGRHVHIATVNAYLAERDFRRFAPVLQALGLRVGLIHGGQSPQSKAQAYQSSVVYGTGYEFGFDYLREQLRLIRSRSPVLGDRYRTLFDHGAAAALPQMQLDCAIIDEMDSVLLDEACVPLILSEAAASSNEDPGIIAAAHETAARLHRDEHFCFDPLRRSLTATVAGFATIDRSLPARGLARLRRPWRSYVEHALIAAWVLQRDIDYLVADGRIWLVDGSTGRIFDDRRWPEGLQQAVEHKEGIPFSPPTFGAARITRQRFFTLYRSLAGTSGTLVEAADELRETYNLRLTVVAPNKQSRRVEWPTQYFVDDTGRAIAVVAEAAVQQRLGRPVLIGCRTIQAAGVIAKSFHAAGIEYRLLDGRQTEDEARIVAQAGRDGNVTIATNLAGRGTDILLDDAARQAGGLHVIGVERHDSSRVDRQLLGRAGRQGDPGTGRFFVSAEDAILRPFPEAAQRVSAATGGSKRIDHDGELRRCQAALESQARLRRRETAMHNSRLDDLLDVLAKPE